ncbi:aminopeptidase N [Arcticibacter tournemirensis]|uniref:M1 family metallopeptidase n=1 Tax=Arcticibacter tournemirensis TaxID=699437 RepID=A0A5M9HF92_9SPHI|nr:M1 family metallopeptidase [Arcticibacter tournemirensis]KAA8485273.1 M1 family metallopeptidase [Arcticibacter tournemirensis]TQM50443.1 aminopeptidase N [Arcticibacter tournemirensis]
MKQRILSILLGILIWDAAFSQSQNNPGSNHGNKFEQLGQILQDPNMYRSASGAPGPHYWQQRADYLIDVELDDSKQRITGNETITYFNNSPDPLTYLWIQLDENQHDPNNDNNKINSSSLKEQMNYMDLKRIIGFNEDLGVKILKVSDERGNALKYVINHTMMRIDLPSTLQPNSRIQFKISWYYNIPNRMTVGGRGGYEYFAEDGNYLYTITQWYPRLAVYSDFQGWQNKQFIGAGEFALPFGNFKVNITVPADHVIGATGECQNYAQVLSSTQLSRWKSAQSAKEPVEIVNLTEAKKAMGQKSKAKKTWTYVATNVRDFAFVASRRLVWDAMATYIDGKKTMAMSYYGPEAYPLYRKYSTKVVAHTLKTYSKYTVPYPYPVAISVEAANGMEYPMICFNYGRAEKDGTYSEAIKYGMIGVIIHEVGHNFFPMIVNSDERQWTWMDEGLNTFCQFLTEQEWDNNYPSQRGPAHKIVDYMKLPKDQLEPVMTNSENIINFGPNAYAKPATALNILRETVMGRELFDYAFKEYARRWKFKHPTPSDFFRTMEDASAVDLDWFWRGWFYGIDPVDIAIDNVKHYRMNTKDPAIENKEDKKEYESGLYDIGRERNRAAGIKFAIDQDTSLKDFYNKFDRFEVRANSVESFNDYYNSLTAEEKELYNSKKNFYELSFSNIGGLVMPIIIEWTYADGSKEVERIPAYIWRKDENNVTRVFAKDKDVVSVKLDPYRETADIDESNNSWPRQYQPSRFELFKQKQSIRGSSEGSNPMQDARK